MVVTVAEAEWRALPDDNRAAMAQDKFDVLVTIDQRFEFEHNLAKLTFGIVMVHVRKNRIDYYVFDKRPTQETKGPMN